MMRVVNVLALAATVANAGCLFGSSPSFKATPTPNDGVMQYVHTTKQITDILANDQDVLLLIKAPFHCPPCEAVEKMLKEHGAALVEKNAADVQFRVNDLAFHDKFTNSWEAGTIMRDTLIGGLVQSYPTLLHFKSGGDVTDAGAVVDAGLIGKLLRDKRFRGGVPASTKLWAAMLDYVADRRKKTAEQRVQLKAQMPFDQTSVPADFSGFAIFVDDDENRVQWQARQYAASFSWMDKVPALNYGGLIFVKDTARAGEVALYVSGVQKVVRKSFVPQMDELEPFKKLVRDVNPMKAVAPAVPVAAPVATPDEKVQEKAAEPEAEPAPKCDGEACVEPEAEP